MTEIVKIITDVIILIAALVKAGEDGDKKNG